MAAAVTAWPPPDVEGGAAEHMGNLKRLDCFPTLRLVKRMGHFARRIFGAPNTSPHRASVAMTITKTLMV